MKNTNTAINVENINKIYRIGIKEGTHDNFVSSMVDFLKSPLKNFKKYRSYYNFDDIDLTDLDTSTNSDDIIWAVKNVSFQVKQGEVLGLIGGNGAGKSTLLKILSKITDPTSGQAELNGKVCSLLEVGTGFHQELTGRENVYLNGTILGMKKIEVDRKFDEIVEFSGVAKFIDTPVKRYSSGMKVRLAFAVAAFMEPEILLIDEVLAVGDAKFQAKSLGKMSEVSKQGRTVIFVSHNMAAVEHLCDRVVLLESGSVKLDTDPTTAIKEYFESVVDDTKEDNLAKIPRNPMYTPVLQQIEFINNDGNPVSTIQAGDPLTVHIHYQHSDSLKEAYFGLLFENMLGVKIFLVQTKLQRGPLPTLRPSGIIECKINRLPLLPGTYYITAGCGAESKQLDHIERACELQVTAADVFGTGRTPSTKSAMIFVDATWEVVEGL